VALDATRDNKIVQDLEDGGLDVDPVSFSSSTKRTLIENLITRLETGEVTLPASANTLINELEVYEFDRTESGRVSYSAPSGFHDDCVDALALAAKEQQPNRVIERTARTNVSHRTRGPNR
jgi:exonuclease VII small subunit